MLNGKTVISTIMATSDFISSIGHEPICKIEQEFDPSDKHGADIRFHGVVRDSEDGRTISAIRYSFYEGMADKELRKIGSDMTERYPDHRALVYHRVGEVEAGVASILIRVQTAHSARGFEIIQEYLKRIKQSVPIWKQPLFVDS